MDNSVKYLSLGPAELLSVGSISSGEPVGRAVVPRLEAVAQCESTCLLSGEHKVIPQRFPLQVFEWKVM